MRFEPEKMMLVALVVLTMFTVQFWEPGSTSFADITGNAIAAFSAGVIVTEVAADTKSATGDAVANGGPVTVDIPIDYNGIGIMTITIAKPTGFTGGSSWVIIENGVTKQVEDLGTNVRWNANLSAGSATLQVVVPAPLLIVESIDETATVYQAQVRVEADYHVDNVTAQITVDAAFTDYTLRERVGGDWVDRTDAYHFTVDGTTATWYGFGISTKIFRVMSEQENPDVTLQPRGSQQTTAQRTTNTTNVSRAGTGLIVQGLVELAILEGQASMFDISISAADRPMELRIDAPTFLEVPATVTVHANTTTNLTVKTLPLSAGEWSGRITLDDGETTWDVDVRILATPQERTAAPEIEQPAAPQPPQRGEDDERNLVPLAAIMVCAILIAAGYIAYLGRKAKGI
jgi:hypothetical protein